MNLKFAFSCFSALLIALFTCSCGAPASFSRSYPQPPTLGPIATDPYERAMQSAEHINRGGTRAGASLGNLGSWIGRGDAITSLGAIAAGAAIFGSVANQSTHTDLKHMMNRASNSEFDRFLTAQKKIAATYRDHSSQALTYAGQIRARPVQPGREAEHRSHLKATREYFKGTQREVNHRARRLMEYRALNSRPGRASRMIGIESDLRASSSRLAAAISQLK